MVLGEGTIPALLGWQSGDYIPDSTMVFSDGLESGDTGAWDRVIPLP